MRGARDLAVLTDRLALLQATRVLGAAAVLGIPAITGAAPRDLVPLAIGYVGLTVLVEAARRVARLRTPWLVSLMLLTDGAFLAIAATLTGGARSPLLFLMFLDVLAVTLLASYRSGLKVALWCALLLFLGQAAVRAGAVDATNPAGDRDAALGAVAFLAVAVAAAAFSAINERALRESRAQLAGLVDLDLELGRAGGQSAGALARHVVERLGFGRCAVVRRTIDGWERVVADGDGAHASVPCPDPSGASTVSVDGANAPRLVRAIDATDPLAAVLPDARNVVVVSLVVDGELLGVAVAEWGAARTRIPSRIAEAVTRAAVHTVLALRNRSLLEEVERLAANDPLTGLANRRVLHGALERETERSRRTGQPLTLVMLDLDHFKAVNDTYGHPAGDAVLRAVGTALSDATKGFDLAARLGGDEFAVLLPNCSSSSASVVGERLRAEAAAAMEYDAVDVSAGVATLPDDACDVDGLIAAADSALYAAKRAGRARATAASTLRACGPAPDLASARACDELSGERPQELVVGFARGGTLE